MSTLPDPSYKSHAWLVYIDTKGKAHAERLTRPGQRPGAVALMARDETQAIERGARILAGREATK